MTNTNPILDTSFEAVFPGEFSKVNFRVYNFLNTQGFAVLRKMQVLRILAERGTEPFYTSDVFVDTTSMGGWMNGLDLNCLIKATGNRKEVEYTIGTWSGEKVCKGYAKEWQLQAPPDEIIKALDTIQAFFIEHI